MGGRSMLALVGLVLIAAGGCESDKVEDGRVRVAEGSYRAPVVVEDMNGHSFALALRTDLSPHEVWAVALDGSGSCSLGAVRGTDVQYGGFWASMPLGVVGESAHPERFIIGAFTDGVGTIRFADLRCRPVPPRLAGVLEDRSLAPRRWGDGTGWGAALETSDHAVHAVDPWAGRDVVIARDPTEWGVANGVGAWTLTGGRLHLWHVDGTPSRTLGTSVTEAVGATEELAYVDGGNVCELGSPAGYVQAFTTAGDACGLMVLEDTTVAFFSPCRDRQLVVHPELRHVGFDVTALYPMTPIVPGARDVVSVHAAPEWLFYTTASANGARTTFAVRGDAGPVEVGAFRDVTGAVRGEVPERGGGVIPVVYVGLETTDGSSIWGAFDGAFHPLATHVHAATTIPGAVALTTDVSNGVGTLRVFATTADLRGSPTPLLVDPGIGADSVVAPADLSTIIDLDAFDAGTATGDLVMRAATGQRVLIDHRATGYADVFAPLRGFVYTVSGGARAGVWLGITGT